tara:strand:+ start:6733 stop:7089 length:357 start_codon:yes stop_codon:yes gene_type:complete
MNTGRMHGKVFIDRPTFTKDGVGGVTETFVEVAEVWREKRHLRGREADEARSQYPEASVVFELWHSPDIAELAADWRLREGTVNFSVIDAIPVPADRAEKFLVYCKSRIAPVTPSVDA